MTLRESVFTAIRWNAFSSVASVFIRLCSISILARILDPEDYGLAAMSGVVLGFAALFQDLGVNSAFIQKQYVSAEQRSSLFWLNVAMSSVLALLMALLSPAFAKFFGDSRVIPLVMLSSMTFVFAALGAQVRMAAQKALNFQPLVVTSIVASIVQLTAAVAMALCGWGVYSIILAGILSSITLTSLSWLFLSDSWRPQLRLKFRDVKPFVAFGGAVVGDRMTNYLNRTIDIFLGGRLLGATGLGFYSIPRNWVFDLNFLVNPIITQIGFPLIAKIQSDIERVRSVYLKTLNMTASVNAPIYLGMSCFADDFVAILLGPGWELSGDLLRILALWGGLRSTLNPVGSLLYGLGRADLSLRWNIGLLAIVPFTVWMGAKWGANGMALALLLLNAALFIPAWYLLVHKTCQATLKEYSVTILKPFVLAALPVISAYWLTINIDGHLARLSAGVLIAAPLYIGVSFFANREWVFAMLELVGQKRNQV